MRLPWLIFALLNVFGLYACQPGVRTSDAPADFSPSAATIPEFPKGKLIPEVAVSAAPAEKYALYLPQNYTRTQSWPVLVCFDAQGRGAYPLQRYQGLADIFQVILAGSHASRNGVPPAQALQIADRMIGDLQQKLKLDPQRIYAAGFSGGARIAALVAQSRADIAGVLACGAGFQPRPQDNFHFAAFVGTEDFNYQEIRQLDEILDEMGRNHLVENFVGGHDWAPVNFMAKGLQWLHFQAIRDGRIARSDTAFANLLTKFRYQDERLKNGGSLYQRWLLRKKVISYLDDSVVVKGLQSEMEKFAALPDVQSEFQRQTQEMQRELAMRQQYGAALATESVDYWKRVSSMLRKVGRNGTRETAWLNLRVLNFLSLSSYFQAQQMLAANALDQADRMLQIYALVDPKNAEHAYLRAGLRARQGRVEAALDFLEQAFSLGFVDRERMQQDPALTPLRQAARFQQLLTSQPQK